MASKGFAAVAANMKLTKNVDKMIVGNSNYLDEGVHDVVVQAVDTSGMDDNKLTVTYLGAEGKTFVDRMFALSQDQSEPSYGLRMLWSALIPDKDAIGQLIDAAAKDAKALEVFTGMKLRINLEPGKGVQVRVQSDGTYAGFDVESNVKVTGDHAKIADARTEVKANGLKQSYLRIKNAECTDKDANLAAFATAMAAAPAQATVARPAI